MAIQFVTDPSFAVMTVYDIPYPWTMLCWVRPTLVDSSVDYAVGMGAVHDLLGYGLGYRESGAYTRSYNHPADVATKATKTVYAHEWHLLAGVWVSATLRHAYIDKCYGSTTTDVGRGTRVFSNRTVGNFNFSSTWRGQSYSTIAYAAVLTCALPLQLLDAMYDNRWYMDAPELSMFLPYLQSSYGNEAFGGQRPAPTRALAMLSSTGGIKYSAAPLNVTWPFRSYSIPASVGGVPWWRTRMEGGIHRLTGGLSP